MPFQVAIPGTDRLSCASRSSCAVAVSGRDLDAVSDPSAALRFARYVRGTPLCVSLRPREAISSAPEAVSSSEVRCGTPRSSTSPRSSALRVRASNSRPQLPSTRPGAPAAQVRRAGMLSSFLPSERRVLTWGVVLHFPAAMFGADSSCVAAARWPEPRRRGADRRRRRSKGQGSRRCDRTRASARAWTARTRAWTGPRRSWNGQQAGQQAGQQFRVWNSQSCGSKFRRRGTDRRVLDRARRSTGTRPTRAWTFRRVGQ